VKTEKERSRKIQVFLSSARSCGRMTSHPDHNLNQHRASRKDSGQSICTPVSCFSSQRFHIQNAIKDRTTLSKEQKKLKNYYIPLSIIACPLRTPYIEIASISGCLPGIKRASHSMSSRPQRKKLRSSPFCNQSCGHCNSSPQPSRRFF